MGLLTQILVQPYSSIEITLSLPVIQVEQLSVTKELMNKLVTGHLLSSQGDLVACLGIV